MIMVILFLILYFFISPYEVYAYLDPGTGSAVLQILIGGLLAGMYLIKRFWKSILVIGKKLKEKLFLGTNHHERE